MVAYSFKARFADPIIALTKLQTIRANGKRRHARPGEAIQLYTAMRTKQCRKLIDTDPICESVTPVRLSFHKQHGPLIFVVGDHQLSCDEMNEFAEQDGFSGGDYGLPVFDMTAFWFENHGKRQDLIEFEGVLIKWHPVQEVPE